MAQRISQMPNEALPFTQESFIGSNVGRGTQAMTQPNSGMKNMNDGGAYTKFINPQPMRNTQGQMQNLQQNAIALGPQKAAEAQGMVVNNMTQQSTADYKAQIGMNNTVANIMEATGNGSATMALSRLPVDKIKNDVGVTRAMGSMQAPELGQLQAETVRYS